MKVAELRKLIGKQITWLDTWCPKRGFIAREGTLLDVKGKNELVDQHGMNDWKWVPDMRNLRAKDA
jgi:hypothetical protein